MNWITTFNLNTPHIMTHLLKLSFNKREATARDYINDYFIHNNR
ncbi:hypothetical protein AWV72_01944 [Lactiplantibacillus plantarum]|nr:hypothetical protein JM48_3116 [Lactiplantibacillus plantarum]AOG32719.1 hypothetical protein AWV72_01944 [Lactiplantibacillus plantarum]QKX11171.1 hypothetical protein Heal19_502565 [Lactiplantibacillus plantarum]